MACTGNAFLCALWTFRFDPPEHLGFCRCIALCNLSAADQNSRLRKYSHILNNVGDILRPQSRDNMSLSFFVEIGGQVCLGTQWWEVPECPGISALVCHSCPNTIDLGTKATHIKTWDTTARDRWTGISALGNILDHQCTINLSYKTSPPTKEQKHNKWYDIGWSQKNTLIRKLTVIHIYGKTGQSARWQWRPHINCHKDPPRERSAMNLGLLGWGSLTQELFGRRGPIQLAELSYESSPPSH